VTTPDRIRTCDLRFRKPTLYPSELRAQHYFRFMMARPHFAKATQGQAILTTGLLFTILEEKTRNQK
jgi:hypothetical protein